MNDDLAVDLIVELQSFHHDISVMMDALRMEIRAAAERRAPEFQALQRRADERARKAGNPSD